ncbi:MAG: LacI family DNA-binding transcriptional regulator [Anaerolineae bacterium]
MAKTYTIRDVARRAGVGIGTVSRVLNDSPSVSEETRQKVLAAIEELNYRPNVLARQLSSGGGMLSIGIIVPFFTRPAFVGRLEGIEHELAQTDYDLILYNVETPEQKHNLFRRVPSERRVDGLIIISLYPTDEDVAHFKRCNMPVVLVDAYHPDLPSITIDDEDGGRQAVQHLVSLGHQRIAFISDDVETPFGFRASAQRLRGYHQVLREAGISPRPAYQKHGQYGRQNAFYLMQELLDLPEPPTAIFSTSDTQALGAMEAIEKLGLRIPDDISVVGYDDIEVATYIGLTTIRQPFYQSGVEGVHLLMQVLEGMEGSAGSIRLPVSLVVRSTTAPPRVGLPGRTHRPPERQQR